MAYEIEWKAPSGRTYRAPWNSGQPPTEKDMQVQFGKMIDREKVHLRREAFAKQRQAAASAATQGSLTGAAAGIVKPPERKPNPGSFTDRLTGVADQFGKLTGIHLPVPNLDAFQAQLSKGQPAQAFSSLAKSALRGVTGGLTTKRKGPMLTAVDKAAWPVIQEWMNRNPRAPRKAVAEVKEKVRHRALELVYGSNIQIKRGTVDGTIEKLEDLGRVFEAMPSPEVMAAEPDPSKAVAKGLAKGVLSMADPRAPEELAKVAASVLTGGEEGTWEGSKKAAGALLPGFTNLWAGPTPEARAESAVLWVSTLASLGFGAKAGVKALVPKIKARFKVPEHVAVAIVEDLRSIAGKGDYIDVAALEREARVGGKGRGPAAPRGALQPELVKSLPKEKILFGFQWPTKGSKVGKPGEALRPNVGNPRSVEPTIGFEMNPLTVGRRGATPAKGPKAGLTPLEAFIRDAEAAKAKAQAAREASPLRRGVSEDGLAGDATAAERFTRPARARARLAGETEAPTQAGMTPVDRFMRDAEAARASTRARVAQGRMSPFGSRRGEADPDYGAVREGGEVRATEASTGQDAGGSLQGRTYSVGSAAARARFRAAIESVQSKAKSGPSVEVKPAGFYEDPATKLYMAPDGSAGAAVSPSGELVSVFQHPDSKFPIEPILREAAQQANMMTTHDVGGAAKSKLDRAFPGGWKARETPHGTLLQHPSGNSVLVAELDQIPASAAELFAQTGRKRLAPGEFVAGKTFLTDGTHHLGADAIVALAKGAGETTVFHEAFHTVEKMGLLKRGEREALLSRFGTMERAAEAYASWLNGRGKPQPVFQRINRFFKDLWRSATDARYRRSQGAFKAIEKGKVWNRTPQTPRGKAWDASFSLENRGVGFEQGAELKFGREGSQKLTKLPGWRLAKDGDRVAARQVVEKAITNELVATALEMIRPTDYIVHVRGLEENGRFNALPGVFAERLAQVTDAPLVHGIVQTVKGSHTGKSWMIRMLNRSEFDGPVVKGARYWIVDDHTTLGTTVADLAAYIRENGGIPEGAFSLTAGGSDFLGGSNFLTVSKADAAALRKRYGALVKETFGVKPEHLTHSEAQNLLNSGSLERLHQWADYVSNTLGKPKDHALFVDVQEALEESYNQAAASIAERVNTGGDIASPSEQAGLVMRLKKLRTEMSKASAELTKARAGGDRFAANFAQKVIDNHARGSTEILRALQRSHVPAAQIRKIIEWLTAGKRL